MEDSPSINQLINRLRELQAGMNKILDPSEREVFEDDLALELRIILSTFEEMLEDIIQTQEERH